MVDSVGSKNVLEFPAGRGKRKPLNIRDVDTILFQTVDDRHLYITDQEQIAKIMRMIVADKITILEDTLK